MRRKTRQLELGIKPVYKWGGRREGAGRTKGARSYVEHRARPFHEACEPVHVTWRLVRGLPTMRSRRLGGAIGRTIRGVTQSHVRRDTGFRILHFSIQPDHLHLIVEAGSKSTLASGLQGLAIWIARRVNEELGRQGAVFAERYHARALTCPRDVRNTIVYVLQNHRHHQPGLYLVDSYSSGLWFDGWAVPVARPPTPSPVADPGTFLARFGWRKHGLIHPKEGPAH